MEEMLANLSQRRSALPLLTEAERRQLLFEWNDTTIDYPKDLSLHQLFEAQVEQTPNAVAAIYKNEHLTYREMNNKANQLAHYLQRLDVGPEVLVGICIERSLDMLVGLLGVLKAGGAYLPLDPAYPPERLTFMLQDAQAPVLVTRQHSAVPLSIQDAHIVCLDDDTIDLTSMSTDNPVSVALLDDLAYTIYTSGSTGQPKGVQITHRSLLNVVHWYRETFAVKPSDRATLFFSPAFDVTGEDLWSHLTAGSCLYLVDESISFNPTAIRDWLVDNRITIANFPTILVESLLTLEWPSTSSLRFMLVGGDMLHSYPPASLPFALINNYGPSETTIVATAGRVSPTEHATMSPSIGRPIANTYIYILDEHLQPVAIGEPGEIYIGGVGVARGYLNRPELTTEKFIADPFRNQPGARLYKTGDLARYLPDGQIMFLGRIDRQVKIRGFRIELGEIESQLAQHPAVQQSVVIVHDDMRGKHLIAYVVPQPQQLLTPGDLRGYLKAKFPDYMVPSIFVLLEKLPLLPNGKVDRQVLPTSDYSHSAESFVAPRTPIEKIVAASWLQVLGIERVSIHDNFFSLGGHSLLATQVISRLRTLTQVDVPLHDFFNAPTIAQLARIITQLQTQSSSLKKPVLRARDREDYRVSRSTLHPTQQCSGSSQE